MPQPAELEFKSQLWGMSKQIKAALPHQITVEHFCSIVCQSVQEEPDLLMANRQSVFNACLKCAADGLLPDKREAAIAIFNSRDGKIAVYMPMVGGFLKKLRQSGQLETISAHCIYSCDIFEYELGDNERIVHKRDINAKLEDTDVIGVYARAKTKDGGVYRVIMNRAEIEKVRSVSRSKDNENAPWKKWFPQQCEKTAVKRLCKYLPSSTDIEQIIDRDEEDDATASVSLNGPTLPAPATPPQSQASAARQIEQAVRENVPAQMSRTDQVTQKMVDQARAKRETDLRQAGVTPESHASIEVDPNTGEVLNPRSEDFGGDDDNAPPQHAQPPAQTAPAPTAPTAEPEKPKRRRGGYVRSGDSGPFTPVDENLKPRVQAAPQAPAAPTPPAPTAAVKPAAQATQQPKVETDRVRFEAGNYEWTEIPAQNGQPATKTKDRLRLTDSLSGQWYLGGNDVDNAKLVKFECIGKKAHATIHWYEGDDKRRWITKIEPEVSTPPAPAMEDRL